METSVKFQRRASAGLAAWAAVLARDPAIAAGIQAALIAELTQRLVAAAGLPADRVTNHRTKPTTYWVQLDGRTWVQYVIRDYRVGVFRHTRRVIVTGLASRPAL